MPTRAHTHTPLRLDLFGPQEPPEAHGVHTLYHGFWVVIPGTDTRNQEGEQDTGWGGGK